MKNITFEKYQGNWNDFIVIDSRGNDLYKNYKTNKIFDIKNICNRQFGIGADGVIFIEEPNEDNYAKIIIFNSVVLKHKCVETELGVKLSIST